MLHLVTLATIVSLLTPPPAPPPRDATARAQNAAPLPRINACSLLPKEEVKKHLPWEPMFDQMPIEEDEIGASGSGCGYPTVQVQVMANPERMLEIVRKRGGFETITGIGDEAYFAVSKAGYAELYVRVGPRVLTLQASKPAGGTMESAKPGVLSLARALVSKLPK